MNPLRWHRCRACGRYDTDRDPDAVGLPQLLCYHSPCDGEVMERVPDPIRALQGLRHSVAGCWGLEEFELRQLLSNTNYNVVEHWLGEADSALRNAKEGKG